MTIDEINPNQSYHLKKIGITNLSFYAVIIILLYLLVFNNEYPPLLDLPNHIARAFIIQNINDDLFSRYFKLNLSIVPNLGFDILIQFFLLFTNNFLLASNIIVFISISLLFTGALVLGYQVTGVITPFSFASGALVFNGLFYMGFMSFLLSVGIALIFAAALVKRLEFGFRNCLMISLASLVLFVTHLFGVAVLLWLLACMIGARLWEGKIKLTRAIQSLLMLLIASVPCVVLLLISPTGDGSSLYQSSNIENKIYGILYFFGSLGDNIDVLYPRAVFIIIITLIMAVTIKYAWNLSVSKFGIIVTASGFLIFLVSPERMLSGTSVDWRILVPTSLLFCTSFFQSKLDHATVRIQKSKVFSQVVTALLIVLLITEWSLYIIRSDAMKARVLELKTVADEVPEGSRVLFSAPETLQLDLINPPPLLHIAGYLLLDKRIIIPSLFAISGQQAISYRSEFRDLIHLSNSNPGIYEVQKLDIFFEFFDFVVILHPDVFSKRSEDLSFVESSCVSEMKWSAHFTLYKINSGQSCGSSDD